MYRIFAYIRYLLRAVNSHGIHPPFLFDLYNNVIHKKYFFVDFESAEQMRTNYLQDTTLLHVTDLGAGSKNQTKPQRQIREIAKTSLSKPKYSRLQYRLIQHFMPRTVIELGTSLGINTMYLAKANLSSQVHTIEGCPQIANMAIQTFKNHRLDGIHTHIGNFNDLLQPLLEQLGQVDYMYIDGNHRKEATYSYFLLCLPHLHEESILVFDDIHWSRPMHEAWQMIIGHKEVTLSIDLFQIGIVFFRKSLSKQNFTVKF